MSTSDSRRPRRLDDWLRRSGLGEVAGRARALQQQERRIWQALSRLINGEWRLARLDGEELVVVVESPAHASAVRYRQRQILQAVEQATGTRPKRARVRIAPTRGRPRPAPRREMSSQASEHIEAAAHATDEPRLREALLRLARNGKPRR